MRAPAALFTLVAAAWSGAALASHQRFRLFTGEQGLSQMSVEAVVEDEDGFLWVGTQSGLDRFDGRRFLSFGVEDGLSSRRIRALAVGLGAVWVGTDGGLDRIVGGRVEPFGRAHGLEPALVRALAVDGPTLWVGHARGLFRLEGEAFVREPTIDQPVQALLVRPEGGLLVAGATCTWARSAEGTWRRIEGEIGVNTFEVGEGGVILAGTTEGEVRRLEAGRWRLALVPDPVNRAPIYALLLDRFGALWVGDEYGLARHRDGALRRFGVADRLRLGNVGVLLETSTGDLWAGGFGGLAHFVGRPFEVFDEADGLPSANTRPVVRTADGALWVGTNRGLARFDGARFESFGVEDGLPSVYVTDLEATADGRLWVGTSRGLVSFHEGEGWRRWLEGVGDGAPAIEQDSSGRLWVTVVHAGVYVGGVGGFERVEAPVGAPFDDPRMLIDRADRVWISDERGLLRLDASSGRARRFTTADGLAHPKPYYLAEGPDGALWFGYHEEVGFSRFDGVGVRTWTTADGLAHDSVYSLGFGADGALWVGTARGVDRFADGRFVNYGRPEGYPSTESNAGGFLLEPDGRIWFGTAEGLVRYDPRRDTRAAAAPRLLLERLSVGGRAVPEDGAVLSPEGADLELALGLLDYEHPRHLDLRARLRGLSERWVPLAEPRWSVPALGPGGYTLEVEARRGLGGPVARVARSFVVAAPWWSHGWVWLVAGLAIGGLLLLAARLRVRALAKQNERLTEMVAARTANLEAKARELERMRDDLRQTNEELRGASAAKSQFVANVSHEIRTPMNGILGMTDLALAEPLSPTLREYLETVRASGRDLLALINDILDLSRIEAGRMNLEPAPASLTGLLRGLERQFAVAARDKGLRLEVMMQDGLRDRWRMDAGRLRQVLVNLIGNALKFTHEGGVEVRARELEGAPGGLELEVSDTGIGIPEAQQARVFELFTQADGSSTRQYGGSGLGLTICREIVALMGGEISVRSEVGVGSTFRFTVKVEPADDVPSEDLPERASAQLELPMSASPKNPAGLRVLVAEDNPVNRLVVRRMLERLGHEVVAVEDGAQAVDAASQQRFDVVLMDLQMPNLDGLEAAARIRAAENGRRLPIVALTAHAMAGDRERALAAGMDDYLTKPISPEALRRALEAVYLERATS